MALVAGVASLVAFSLFLARALRRSSSLMPLVAVSAAMLWFTLCGTLGLLRLGGFVWYAGSAAALCWVVYKEKKRTWRLFTPGLVFFAVGSLAFVALFAATRPLLTNWDEFTFWGTAGKVVSEANALYTTAQSNLIARSYPPGLIVFSYMMQFFGRGFAEYGFIASFAVVYLSAFAVPAALWRKNRNGAFVFLAGLLLLPFLFDVHLPGNVSSAYLACMADMPMAALFGGALCLYYAGGEKDGRLLALVCVVLAALTNVKDMGLALACVALAVVLVDLAVCERHTFTLFRLRRFKAIGAAALCGFGSIGATYAAWALHLNFSAHINRTDLGSGSQSLGMVDMLVRGAKALLRIAPDPVFDDRARKMAAAFLERPVWLLGSGLLVLGALVAILACAWVLSTDKRSQRRVAAFTVAMALGFVAFYIFNLFTYTYILKGGESETLKDYHRYIFPYWAGWWMGAMTMLAIPANRVPASARRARAARAVSLLLVLCMAGGVALRVNWQANFARVSPSLYGERLDVKEVVHTAKAQGMQPGHVVYLISQGDDASRFYLFSYELDAQLKPLYGGGEQPEGTTAATLASPALAPEDVGWDDWVYCSPEELAAYLAETGCTHVLVDVPDEYIIEDFGPLFEGGFAGWTPDGLYEGGLRYYRIEYTATGARFVAAEGGSA